MTADTVRSKQAKRNSALHRGIDLPVGTKFNRLTVASFVGVLGRSTAAFFKCVCDCGKTKIVRGDRLRHGHTKSCGCINKERCTTHGYANKGRRPPEYQSWCGMIQRCEDVNSPSYVHYGGRGITIHPSLRRFEDFLAYMGPSKGLTIERIDVNGHYEPSNLRWATGLEQRQNTRRNVYVCYEHKNMILAEAIRKAGLNKSTVENFRTRTGVSTQDAFDQVLCRRNKKLSNVNQNSRN